jgi:glutathione synthase/RimK-type ligase-like ATP-grasp enzyme
MKQLVILDHLQKEFYNREDIDIVLARDYLNGNVSFTQKRYSKVFKIVNLCSQTHYLSQGYYCSLLARARDEQIIPSVDTLLMMHYKRLHKGLIKELNQFFERSRHKWKITADKESFFLFFGNSSDERFANIAPRIYEAFTVPILKVTVSENPATRIHQVEMTPFKSLSGELQLLFFENLHRYGNVKHPTRSLRKTPDYYLGILVNEKNPMPPSNSKALRKFVKIGSQMGFHVDLIHRKDLNRIKEYDAIFIRETTALDHYTYTFARKAEQEGIVVLDDPASIVKCTNKVYLAELFRTNGIPTPKTVILDKNNYLQAENKLGFPFVVKIPDGSFGTGVYKISSRKELETLKNKLLDESDLLLAQEFVSTDYDWRIGILNNVPLFVCKYFMAPNHWKIIKTSQKAAERWTAGKVECYRIDDAPTDLLELAIRSSKLIGEGLYGIDIKESNGRYLLMEINDNPNIDNGYEDRILKDDLYRIILGEFIRRIET